MKGKINSLTDYRQIAMDSRKHHHSPFMRLYQLWIIPLAVILAIVLGNRANRLLQEAEETLKKPGNFTASRILLDTVVNLSLFQSNNEENIEKGFQFVENLNNRISRYVPGSEIQLLNARTPSFRVSRDVWYLLNRALEFAAISNGAFDPTVGALVDIWSIGTTDARVPEKDEILRALTLVDYRKIQLDQEEFQVKIPVEGMKLDMGGISKGWIADRTIKFLKKAGESHILLDIGGNIRVNGGKSAEKPFRIGVQNPFAHRGIHFGIFTLKDGSLVSSGSYERFFEHKGKRYHHILSTQNGYPAENNLISVTVVSTEGIDGDALSTSLFALGLEKGMELLSSFPNVQAIFVEGDEKNKTIILSPGADKIFELTSPEFHSFVYEKS